MKTIYLNNTTWLLKMSTFILFGTVIGVNPVKSAETGEYDSKHYSGSICRDATPNEYINGTTYDDMGYVANKRSDRNLTVVCPLIRDNTNNRLGISGIGVYFTDSHPFENIDCEVTSRRMNGDYYSGSNHMVSKDVSSGALWLGAPIRLRGQNYFFDLTCTIPPKSESGDLSVIKSIVVTEFDR